MDGQRINEDYREIMVTLAAKQAVESRRAEGYRSAFKRVMKLVDGYKLTVSNLRFVLNSDLDEKSIFDDDRFVPLADIDVAYTMKDGKSVVDGFYDYTTGKRVDEFGRRDDDTSREAA